MSESIYQSAKVLFRIPGEDGTVESESLWADSLGGDRFRLENCPFFAYGVSLHDIVRAPVDPDEQAATFQRVIVKSGNSTVRILFDEPVEDGNSPQVILDQLISLGCSYEGANRKYIAVNIPSSVNLSTVCSFLVEQQLSWEYADPTYEQIRAGA